MDSEEQHRRQRIESICYDYLEGDTPVLACTLLKGEFLSSPWRDNKKPYQAYRPTSPPKSQNSSIKSSNAPPSPPHDSPTTSIHDESTQEFDSDNERTIPYDVYDMETSQPENMNLTISSSPPK